jgi:uncharacterized protein
MDEITELIKTASNNELEKRIEENPSLANGKTEQGISFLQFAAYCRNQFAIDLLKKYKNTLDIFEAASIGDINTMILLLDRNLRLLNSFSADGFTILGLASFFGHGSLVKLLLDKGADPNIAANNQLKVSPLHSACAISDYHIAGMLIDHGADVNARQMQNVTPLHSAAHNGQTQLAGLLIEHGADVNAKTDSGQTPLFMANEKHFYKTAELIRKHGGE